MRRVNLIISEDLHEGRIKETCNIHIFFIRNIFLSNIKLCIPFDERAAVEYACGRLCAKIKMTERLFPLGCTIRRLRRRLRSNLLLVLTSLCEEKS